MSTVSIGIPVYNGEKYLEAALASVVGQTHQDLEIIISDNASTDGTERICRELAERDARVRYVRQPVNRGAAYNHNVLAEYATGDYFRWLAIDDAMAPTCIEECVRVLDARPDVSLAWPRPTVIDELGTVDSSFYVDLTFDGTTAFSRLRSRIGRRTDDEQTGWCFPVYGLTRLADFRSTLPMGSYFASDQVMLAQLAVLGRWVELPENLFFCRVHPGNSTTANTRHELTTWMDPGMTLGRSMPAWRRWWGFARVALFAPAPVLEKARCLALVAVWPLTLRHAKLLWWDLKVWFQAKGWQAAPAPVKTAPA